MRQEGGELPALGKAEAAEITHLVGRVDHIKLLNQLQGNKVSIKQAADLKVLHHLMAAFF